MSKISNGILFTGGSVFDGTGFLEQGTHVLVRDGKISALGTDVEPGGYIVDLDGGTSARLHRRARAPGLRRPATARVRPGEGQRLRRLLDIVAATRRRTPAWSGSSAAGGDCPRSPADPHQAGTGQRCSAAGVLVQPRPSRRVGQQQGPGSGGHRPPHTGSGRRQDRAGRGRRARRHAAGRRYEAGEPLLPEITGDDKYRGLLAAQDYLLSLGSPAGRTHRRARLRLH